VKRYLVSARYDWAFFLLPPVASLAIGVALSYTALFRNPFGLNGERTTVAELLVGALTHAHLVSVFFRSHGNPSIRRLHPVRFVVVPVLMWVAIASSDHLAIIAIVVGTWWDVYHSGAQTFGFARIYDRNCGNHPDTMRRLDFWMNQLLYAGPILASATLARHLADFDAFSDVDWSLFARVPAWVEGRQRYLTWTMVVGGLAFIAFYCASYLRLHRRGYQVSGLKVFLIASTGACSIWCWAFNSWGEAFFVMNLFHSVQYLALIWATERKPLLQRLGGPRRLVLGLLVTAVLAYGVAAQIVHQDFRIFWSLTMTVSLLHFWYDGFIWSVARRQI
jgi:hypothetical protein